MVPGLAAVAVPVALGLLMLVGASVWISHFEAHPEHRPRVWCKSARWAMWWTFLACVAGMFALMKVRLQSVDFRIGVGIGVAGWVASSFFFFFFCCCCLVCVCVFG